MSLELRQSMLGVEVFDGAQPVTLYRVREELDRLESPKPGFAPIYTPRGRLVTEYRPADHLWHTGLFFGWVHANESNLWGGPWFIPASGKYEAVDTHGIQRHDGFTELAVGADGSARIGERLSWLDAQDRVFAGEERHIAIALCDHGYRWTIETRIQPWGAPLSLGATRAPAGYSGLVLRLGPPFAPYRTPQPQVLARCSESRQGHEQIMGQRARWVCVSGAKGGMVVLLDHPDNPRHPVTWYCRANLLGVAPLATGDLVVEEGSTLRLRYGLLILDEPAAVDTIEAAFRHLAQRECIPQE